MQTAGKENAVVCALQHADHDKNGAELTEKITLVMMEQSVSRSRSSHFVMAETLLPLQAGKVAISKPTQFGFGQKSEQNRTEQNML